MYLIGLYDFWESNKCTILWLKFQRVFYGLLLYVPDMSDALINNIIGLLIIPAHAGVQLNVHIN